MPNHKSPKPTQRKWGADLGLAGSPGSRPGSSVSPTTDEKRTELKCLASCGELQGITSQGMKGSEGDGSESVRVL